MPKTTSKKSTKRASTRKSRSKRGGSLVAFQSVDAINAALENIKIILTCDQKITLSEGETLTFSPAPSNDGTNGFNLVVNTSNPSKPIVLLENASFTFEEILEGFKLTVDAEGNAPALALVCPEDVPAAPSATVPPNAMTNTPNRANPTVPPNNVTQQQLPNGSVANANVLVSANGAAGAHGGKKTKGKKATSKRVKVGGAERVVYEGPRGGQYIKMNGGFLNLKELAKKRNNK